MYITKRAVVWYLAVLIGILVVYGVGMTAAYMVFGATADNLPVTATPVTIDPVTGEIIKTPTKPTPEKPGLIESLFTPPNQTTVLVMGTDADGTRTDIMFLAVYNAPEQKIDVISLPRDTLVQLSKAEISDMQALGRKPPSSGVCKLNEVHAYAGNKEGPNFSKRYVENLLDIQIDYYVRMDLRAFRNIVECVGGIYMDIPRGGLYYNDPEQNLKIAVPEGHQLLNGEMAEGVVRYRDTYAGGDVQRIGVQQKFMKEFFTQVLQKDKLMNDVPGLISTFVSYVTTDFSITNIPRYLSAVESLKSENIVFTTLPGEPRTLESPRGSYYIVDIAESKKLIDSVYAEPIPTPSPTPTPIQIFDPKKMKLTVLNGGNTSGLAATTRDRLKEMGYNVVRAANYEGEKTSKTRIIVRTDGDYSELLGLFTNSELVIDSSLSKEQDIMLIIGIDSKINE